MNDPPAGDGIGRPRVAVVGASLPAHAELLEQLAEHGVPGHVVDVVRSEPGNAAGYDLIHLLADGPASLHVPDHDEADLVLSPSRAADHRLIARGVDPERIARFQRGVDVRRYHPARYAPEALPPPDSFNILHVGDDGLARQAFEIARGHNPRLRLVLASAVPAPTPDRLAQLYASCDLLLATDPGDAGDGILEAQASGLPVLAVNTGAAPELIANGRSGCLIVPDPVAIAAALHGLARRAAVLERLATGGLLAIRGRSWEASLEQLADAYTRALQPALGEIARAA